MNRESIHSFDLTSNQLKLLAIVSMVVDHTGAVLFPQYRLLRLIGRAAFPIYVFLLVEGFFHTHSRPKYLLRLSVFALISEVPFDLALYSQAFNGYRCNVFFTLAIGMVLMMLADKLVQSPPASPKELPQALFAVALLMGCFCLADWLKTDYGAAGVLAIGAGYCLARIGLQGGIVFAGIVVVSIVIVWLYMHLRHCPLSCAIMAVLVGGTRPCSISFTPFTRHICWCCI